MAKKTWFSAAAGANSTADIAIYDEIGCWGVNAGDFRDALAAMGPVDAINLRLNSPGGDVFDGIAIHNMLARHPAKVNVTVDGIAASIASLVAMAGDVVTMPENAMMFVHNPFGMAMGDATDMAEMSDALGKIGTAMASTYARKTGQTPEDILAIMDAGTWMTAQDAKDKGFADVVAPPAQITARFDVRRLALPAPVAARLQAAYDPDGDGDDDALEAIGYIGQAIDNLADAVGCLTGTGDEDDEPGTTPGMAAALRKLVRATGALQRPLAAAEEWRVGAARDLPIDEADGWDGPAAVERMLDAAGFNGDSPDSAKARRGFLVWDAGNPKLKGSYKVPFADVVGGELRAIAGGLAAAAQRLPQTDIPDDLKSRAQAVLDAYSKRREQHQQGDPMASAGADAEEIASLCLLAEMPERTFEFLKSGNSPAEVRSALQALRADRGRGAGPEISARHNLATASSCPAAGWARAIEKINSRQAL